MALIVTSRGEDHFGYDVNPITLEPLRIDADRFVSFIDAYLRRREVRSDFDDTRFLEACTQLSRLLVQRPATILLTKLFADQMVAQRDSDRPELPTTTPDLMLAYVNDLNRRRPPDAPDDPTLHLALRQIAWECLRETLRPAAVLLESLEKKLEDLGGSQALIPYLLEDLRLLQLVEPRKDRVRFVLDPLAEYFAAMELVARYAGEQERWKSFLLKADRINGAPKSIQGLFAALLDCIDAMQGAEEKRVPKNVIEQLQRRAGLDPEVVERSRKAQRVQTLAGRLESEEDRSQAIRELREMGELRAAAPALARLASTRDQDLQNQMVSLLLSIGAAASPHLSTLSCVTELCPVYVENLELLAGLTQLKSLNLDNTSVEDLGPLAGLTQLNWLSLSNTLVEDLGPLAGLTQLNSLRLSGTGVEGLAPLAALMNLSELDLRETQVEDLEPLAGLVQLSSLLLSGQHDLAPLAGLANLKVHVR